MEQNKLIDQLDSSPLFAMSLGSKELFHSNFWAWLIERDHRFASALFPGIDCSLIEDVEREQNNRDITLWGNDEQKHKIAYILENKIKSLPDKDQLARYAAVFDDWRPKDKPALKGAVLVSLVKPSFEMDAPWTYRSFLDVVCAIEKIYPSTELSDDDKRIIARYCEDAHAIDKLVKTEDAELGEKLPVKGEMDDLEKVHFGDLVSKLKAEELSRYFREQPWFSELDSQAQKWGFKLETSSNFANKHGITDLRFTKTFLDGAKAKDNVVIGLQIQADEYRRMAQRCGGGESQNEAIFQEFKNYGWFVDYDPKTNRIFGNETKMTKLYGKYDGPANYLYHFVYQYFNIPDYSFKALGEQAKKDLELALSLLQDINAKKR